MTIKAPVKVGEVLEAAKAAKTPNSGPRPITLDRLKKKQPLQQTILIPACDEDSELLDKVKSDLQRAELLDEGLDKAKAAVQVAEDHIRATGLEFVFRGIGRKKFEKLQREHEPTPEQVKEHGESLSWNPETFLPALLELTVVNSDLTAEQWNTDVMDSDDWGVSEIGLICQTAIAVNRGNRVASLGN
jgi:hypothetical protein